MGDRWQLPPHNINICLLWSSAAQEIQISIYRIYIYGVDANDVRGKEWARDRKMSIELTSDFNDAFAWHRHAMKGIHPYGLSCTKLKIQYIIMLTIYIFFVVELVELTAISHHTD